jgi:hypothetical protein
VVDGIAEIAVAVAVAGAAAAAVVVAVEGETATREYFPEEITRPRLTSRDPASAVIFPHSGGSSAVAAGVRRALAADRQSSFSAFGALRQR